LFGEAIENRTGRRTARRKAKPIIRTERPLGDTPARRARSSDSPRRTSSVLIQAPTANPGSPAWRAPAPRDAIQKGRAGRQASGNRKEKTRRRGEKKRQSIHCGDPPAQSLSAGFVCCGRRTTRGGRRRRTRLATKKDAVRWVPCALPPDPRASARSRS
jgi:hypothetical protein